MAIITLTTDFGLKDYYVSAVKGSILNLYASANIIDISHEISPFNDIEAAFVLKNSYPHFPPGSVHIMGVRVQPASNIPYVAIYADGHYFIGADNGMFSLIFDKEPDKIIHLEIAQDVNYFSFPVKDIFVKAACHIAQGGSLEKIGTIKTALAQKMPHKPNTDNNHIRGIAIYIDVYGNVITNITKNIFQDIGKGRDFELSFARGYPINLISLSYNDVPQGETLALFGLSGFLEIALNEGMANKLLSIKLHDPITIHFEDN